MKKIIVVAIVIGLLAGAMLAPAEAAKKKKPKKVVRTVEAVYQFPGFGCRESRRWLLARSWQLWQLRRGLGREASVTITLTDRVRDANRFQRGSGHRARRHDEHDRDEPRHVLWNDGRRASSHPRRLRDDDLHLGLGRRSLPDGSRHDRNGNRRVLQPALVEPNDYLRGPGVSPGPLSFCRRPAL